MHLDTDIASIFIAHVTLRAVKVILHCNSVSDLKIGQLSNFDYVANGFVTRNEGNSVTIV